MILKIQVTVSKPLDKDERGYERSEDVGRFTAEAPADEVWEVYRSAVAALTPEARDERG